MPPDRCVFGLTHAGTGVTIAVDDAMRQYVCTDGAVDALAPLPPPYALAMRWLRALPECAAVSPFATYVNHAPSSQDLLDSHVAPSAEWPAGGAVAASSLSRATAVLRTICTFALLLLALQLLVTSRRGSRPRLRSPHAWQFLCAWLMLHLCLQEGLQLLAHAPILTFVNQLCLCLVGLLATSCDWWMTTQLAARLFPGIARSQTSPTVSPQTIIQTVHITEAPADDRACAPQQQQPQPSEAKSGPDGAAGSATLSTSTVLLLPSSELRTSSSSDGSRAPLTSSVFPSPAPIILPWKAGQTPPSISAPPTVTQSPPFLTPPLATGSGLASQCADAPAPPADSAADLASLAAGSVSRGTSGTSVSSACSSIASSAGAGVGVVALPEHGAHTGDVLTASDGSHVLLSSTEGAVAVAPGVPVQAASSSLSQSKNLLKLAKAKLHKLDADYTRSVEEANQRNAFMAFLCHELRNPLQVITANTDFLLEDGGHEDAEGGSGGGGGGPNGNLTADQRELISSVNSSAEIMLSVVNDFLDMSRLQSGRMTFERLPIDLHFVCHSILNISRSQAASKGLRLELHIDESVPRFVISDPTRLHQLLLNLLSNAIKFTQEGCVSLTLRTAKPTEEEERRAAETQEASGGQAAATGTAEGDPAGSPDGSSSDSSARRPRVLVVMEVSDTGCGIAPENIGKLFKPYAQATVSTQREHGGTGLGLSICSSIVAAMAGSISVASDLGKGSRFQTRLLMEVADEDSIRRGLGTSGSYSDSPDLRLQERRGGRSAGRAETILIVDDHEINCKLLSRMAVSLGYSCEVAHDGVEALAAIERNLSSARERAHALGRQTPTPPQATYLCVFLDLNMPRLDGWGALARIRGELGLKTLPVIALTAETLSPEKALEAGFTLSLSKPFRKPALKAVLEAMAERKAQDQADATQGEGQDAVAAAAAAAPASESEQESTGMSSAAQGTPDSGLRTLPHDRRPSLASSTHDLPSPLCSPLSHPSLSGLPASPAHVLDPASVDQALSSLHQATMRPPAASSVSSSASPPPSCASSLSTGSGGGGSAANSPSAHGRSPSRRLSPVSPLNLAALNAIKDAEEGRRGHQPARSVDAGAVSDRHEGPQVVEPLLKEHPLDLHLRTHSEFAGTLASAPNVHSPVSRLPPQACTPSSHRRSLGAASEDDGELLPSRLPAPRPASQSSLANMPSRLRGGGTHSPLSLTGSPRTVSRHLVLEPTTFPLKRGSSTSSVGAAAGQRKAGSKGHGNQSVNSLINDSILRASGYASASTSGDESSRRRPMPRRDSGASVTSSPPVITSTIPPLHPSSHALAQATASASFSPAPSISPAMQLSPPVSSLNRSIASSSDGASSSLSSSASHAHGSAGLSLLSMNSASSSGASSSGGGGGLSSTDASDSSGRSAGGSGAASAREGRRSGQSARGRAASGQWTRSSRASTSLHRSSSDTLPSCSGGRSLSLGGAGGSAGAHRSTSCSSRDSLRSAGSTSGSASPVPAAVSSGARSVGEKSRRAQESLRRCVIDAMGLDLPLPAAAQLASPPALLAPPCTPASPAAQTTYPLLTSSAELPAAPPKPWPARVFKGAGANGGRVEEEAAEDAKQP